MVEQFVKKGKAAVRQVEWLMAMFLFVTAVGTALVKKAVRLGKRVQEVAVPYGKRLWKLCQDWMESRKARGNGRKRLVRPHHGRVPRLVAGLMATCMIMTSVPIPAFAATQVNELPAPTIPSDDLYVRVSWQTTNQVGPGASEKNCEASFLYIYELYDANNIHEFSDKWSYINGISRNFSKDILRSGDKIPIAEYTISQREDRSMLWASFVQSHLGSQRTIGGKFIWEIKNLKTGDWETVNVQETGGISGGDAWRPGEGNDTSTGFYGKEVHKIEYNDPKKPDIIGTAKNGYSHVPMLKGYTLNSTISSVAPSTGDIPMTYIPSGTYTLMTTQGYTWVSNDVYDVQSDSTTTYYRMGKVTYRNPRIVEPTGDNPSKITVSGVTAVENTSKGFSLQVSKDAVNADNQQFRVAFDVVSEKYGTKTTAYSNVITVKAPAADTPAAPSLSGHTAKTITINTISGQKYLMTESSSKPATSASGWEDATGTTRKFSNLTPGKTYYFWTFTPAGSGTVASKVSEPLSVKTDDPVSSVGISFPAPVSGADVTKADGVTVPDGFKVNKIEWHMKSSTGNFVLVGAPRFETSSTYRATVTVDLDSRATDTIFDNSVTGTVNENRATVTRVSDNQIKLVYEFPETDGYLPLQYTINRDGSVWRTQDTAAASNLPVLTVRKNGIMDQNKLNVGEYDIYVKLPGGDDLPTGEKLTVEPGVQPEVTLDYWTVTFHDAADQPLTQGYHTSQFLLSGRSPVEPSGTTLVPPETGQVLTWVTKDDDGAGNIEETPFVIGTDSVFDTTNLYARWVSPISEIAVTGLDEPAGGATPDTTATLSGNNYKVYNITWSPEVINNQFGYQTEYTATVKLMAANGAGFTDNVTGAINGKNAVVSDVSSNMVTLSYKFPATGEDPAAKAAAAAATVKGHTFTVAQATANTEDEVKQWLAGEINSLLTETGVTTTKGGITVSSFQAADAGTSNNESGTNGRFQFTATLSCQGESTTTEAVSGTITATAYTGETKTAAPVFTTSGASFRKTSKGQDEAVFTLKTAPASGTGYYIYTDEACAVGAAATVTVTDTTMKVTGDAVADVTDTTSFYIKAKDGNKEASEPAMVTVYAAPLEQTPAPDFEAGKDSYAKRAENQDTVDYTMTRVYPEGTAYKVYADIASETVVDGVTASGTGSKLTLAGVSGLTEDSTYYISATEPEKTESKRRSVTVLPYRAPSVTTADTDSAVTVYLNNTTDQGQDTINLRYDPGTNPDTVFNVSDFRFTKDYEGNEEAVYLEPVSINPDQGTMTVKLKKYGNGNIYEELWYKDTHVGSIKIDGHYAIKSRDTTLKSLGLSNGELKPAFDPGTTRFEVEVADIVDSIAVTPTTNHERATVTVNGTTVTSGNASDKISLNTGENQIRVKVTAEDTAYTQEYLILVNRLKPVGGTPVFTKDTYTKTSLTEQAAVFTLSSVPTEGTEYKVYKALTGGSPLSMTATWSENQLTIKDISGITSQTSYYISATEPGKSEGGRAKVTILPYNAPAAAPEFDTTTATFTESGDSVTFTLTNHAEGRTYQIYRSGSDTNPLSDPALSENNGVLTLRFTTKPASQTTYYIGAKESGKPESGKTAVIVKPYVAPAVSTPPAFAAGGDAYAKTSADNNSAAFTLANTPASTTEFTVYDAKTGGNKVNVTVNVSNKTITLSGADVANITSETTWYLSATENGKSESSRVPVVISPYMEQSAAPEFTESAYTKQSVADNTASLKLNQEAAETTKFKVYNQKTGGYEANGMAATLDGTDKTVLKVTGIAGITSETTYYISATENGKRESSRTEVRILPYEAPDVSLGGDRTVKVEFSASDPDTATAQDTITVQLDKGSNPETTFVKDDFKLSGSSTDRSTAVNGVQITDLSTDTMTVEVAKNTSAANAWLWYKNTMVGQITIDKTVNEPTSYTVAVDGNIQHGTVTPDKESAAEGEKVTLTVSPASNYELDELKVYKTGVPATTVSVSNNEFTMPAYDVTVTATFKVSQTEDQQAVATAKTAVEGGNYEVKQKDANSEAAVKTWLVNAVNTLLGEGSTGITVQESDITVSEFSAATAEGAGSTGSDGGFTFTVVLEKGNSSDTTEQISGTIAKTPYTTPTEISSVAVTGITAPAAQAAPDTTAGNGENWTAGTVTWEPADNPFKHSTRYTASVTLTAADNYRFAQDVAATVNDEAATVTRSSDTSITVTYQFPATDAEQTTEYNIAYTLSNLKADNQPVTVTEGEQLEATLTAATNYRLPDTITVTMGGETLGTNDYTYNSSTGTITIQTVTGDVEIIADGVEETGQTSSDSTLQSLSYQVDNGSATEVTGFDSSQKEYDVELPAGTSETATVQLSGTPTDSGASVTKNDEITLSSGQGTASITVKAEDGTTSTYSVNFTIKSGSGTFIAVDEITGVPTTAQAGKPLQLEGTVKPTDATNQTISWEITGDGETGATLDDQNRMTAESSGTVEITATIANGTAVGEDYTQTFTIDVAGVASSSDAAYVASASNAVRDGKYKVDQSTTEDESSFLTELVNLINKILEKLFGIGNTEKIETSDISNLQITTDPVAGDEENQSGTDGEFSFDVEIHKGEESQTLEGLTGTIKAKQFTDEEQAAKDQEAVENAIAEIQDATYKVDQKKARDEAALKSILKTKAKSKAGKATVNEIQIVAVEFATAGTFENQQGTDGTFTFKAKVSKGSVTDMWTSEIEGTIIAEEYVLKKPVITTVSLPDGVIGEEYSQTLEAQSDTDVTWSVDGRLPAGLELSEAGELTGIPETPGQFSIRVIADNGSEQGTAAKTYVLTISGQTGATEHTITATAGDGGTISPSGDVVVADGGSQTFTITAADRYYISKVLVDGTSVGRPGSYTFSNVAGNHTIEAVFARGSLGPGTDDDDDGSSGSNSSSGGSGSPAGTTSQIPSTDTNTVATGDGGSVTTTTTTSTDNSGKKTTVTTEVKKDAAGNVTGSTTTVTTDRIQTTAGEGSALVTISPDAAAINNAAGAAGAAAGNPLEVLVKLPQETIAGELQKPEVSSVAVEVLIPKAVSDNPNVEVGVSIGKESIQAAKDLGKGLSVTVRNEDGTVDAVWSMNGQSMQNMPGQAADVNVGLHTAPIQSNDPLAQAVSPLAAANGSGNGLVLNIDGSGVLPQAKLTVPATNQTGIKPGDSVTLYRFDEAAKQLIPVPGGTYVVDANGNVTIDLPVKDFATGPDKYVLLPGAPVTAPAGGSAYQIKKGDTLNKIAREYGCTVEELLELNQVDVMDLQIGQVIQLPAR